jgi:nucleoid DNA-binding protein
MKMNKTGFIEKLKEVLNIDETKANIINNIFETNSIFGKKNKDKIIEDMMNKLKIDLNEANKIYEKVMDIIKDAIKNKIKHPFKSQN